MAMHTETSDVGLIALLREHGALGVSELTAAMNVTATAVRQRLTRLMNQGMIQRETTKPPRGRPSHRYSLTEKGRRQTNSNFADLTVALWREVRSIKNPEIRNGLMQRIAKTLAEVYRSKMQGRNTAERMQRRFSADGRSECLVHGGAQWFAAGADSSGMPVSRIGRTRSRNLRRGKNAVFRIVGRKSTAERVPPRWHKLLPV